MKENREITTKKIVSIILSHITIAILKFKNYYKTYKTNPIILGCKIKLNIYQYEKKK